ncbi:MAG: helix-turn-helix transcriptional regulator [Hydrogenophaga sp.]|uniref:helix-turn-helix domain-containing protein n=1 Tax=Hydrogenophaga sp. TaxID=1904254 RepID=UPI002633C303|nr:helix-turn-helix transcriptional regulator [Hydrogenophaga sp.]MDM7942572.1 helix-turn-helix transcriptional regulator [Hydrogenophaga sp.]
MIRLKLKELLASASFRKGERIRLEEVATATGIHRATLSALSSPRGCNTSTDNLDRLCHYFGCQIQDLVEYVPSDPPAPRTRAKKPVDQADADSTAARSR